MSISGLQGPAHNVDTTQIGVPVVTPRKERPGHKRSLTGKSTLPTPYKPLIDVGSYFPAKAGEESQEWPLGDESTWKEALKAQTVDPESAQEVANSIVRHTTTTLGRQAFNMDDVRAPSCGSRGQLTRRSRHTRRPLFRSVINSLVDGTRLPRELSGSHYMSRIKLTKQVPYQTSSQEDLLPLNRMAYREVSR